MAKKKQDWKWHGGLSDCCNAPIKEYGEGLTIIVCSECEQMCNEKRDEDDFPDDFDFFDE